MPETNGGGPSDGHGGDEIETRLFINNEFVKAQSGKKFSVTDPTTEEITAWVHEANEADIELAVQAATRALPTWSAVGGFEKAAFLYRLADLYEKHNGALAKLEARCMGKPVSKYTEGIACARYLRYTAGQANVIHGESSTQTPGFLNITLREPYGVCAGITPWNAPVTMMTFKLAPAIIAGNTIIIKSSEKAPLTHLYVAKLVKEAGIPPGVVNFVSGAAHTGSILASHMSIRKISFTGSIRAGIAIKKAAAASNLKKVTLELGGKSPLIVFEDADIDKAARSAAFSCVFNSGQACICNSRIYVHESIADQFVKKLVASIKEQGYNPKDTHSPLAESTIRGPQADKTQFETILKFVDEARSAGYTIANGGGAEYEKGYFIEPTIVLQADDDSRIMKEEVFGPVQCVNTFKDEDEVLARANDSEFGLYAAVFTRDVFRALRIARKFEAGSVGVNVASPFMTQDMPFGGYKQSGEGKELGTYQTKEWTQVKSVYFAMS